MRAGIRITVTSGDRLRLEAIVGDRNAKQKHVKRAKVILATAEGCGTNEIMRRSELSKPVVWRSAATLHVRGCGWPHAPADAFDDRLRTTGRVECDFCLIFAP